MSDANKSVVHRWVKAVNEGDADINEELFTPSTHFHVPRGTAPGREGRREWFLNRLTAFPDIHATVEDQIAEGDKVVSRITFRGTHTGPLGGIAPTGKSVEWTIITIDHIQNGKILERFGLPDRMSLYRQLGVVTDPTSG